MTRRRPPTELGVSKSEGLLVDMIIGAHASGFVQCYRRWILLVVAIAWVWLGLAVEAYQESPKAASSVTVEKVGTEPRCDLNNDQRCDRADVEIFDRLLGTSIALVPVGLYASLKHLDVTGDGFITYDDMGGLFPESQFPNEMMWLDRYEQTTRLIVGERTIANPGGGPVVLDPSRVYAATQRAKETLEFAETTFGSKDLKVAKTMELLADAYMLDGAYARAEAFYQQELEIFTHVLGVDGAMDVARRKVIGLYAEWVEKDPEPRQRAESLMKRLIDWETESGKVNPGTLIALAELYYVQHNFDRAEPLYRQAFGLWEDAEAHPSRAVKWMEHYADVLERTGKVAEANTFRYRAKQLGGRKR